MSNIIKKEKVVKLVEETLKKAGHSFISEVKEVKKPIKENKKEEEPIITEKEKPVINEGLNKELDTFKRLINFKY